MWCVTTCTSMGLGCKRGTDADIELLFLTQTLLLICCESDLEFSSAELLAELQTCIHRPLQVSLQTPAEVTEHSGAARENDVLQEETCVHTGSHTHTITYIKHSTHTLTYTHTHTLTETRTHIHNTTHTLRDTHSHRETHIHTHTHSQRHALSETHIHS